MFEEGEANTVNSRERSTPAARSGSILIAVAALSGAALLMTASMAFGAADPLKGGTTTLANLKLPGKVKLAAKGGATKSGKTVTLPITGGTLDPTNGSGPVQNGGSIQLKGKKKVSLTSIVTTFGGRRQHQRQAQGQDDEARDHLRRRSRPRGLRRHRYRRRREADQEGRQGAQQGTRHHPWRLQGGEAEHGPTTTVPLTVGVTSATSSTTEDISGLQAGCSGTGTCTTFVGKLAEDGVSSTPSNGAMVVAGTPRLSRSPRDRWQHRPGLHRWHLDRQPGRHHAGEGPCVDHPGEPER